MNQQEKKRKEKLHQKFLLAIEKIRTEVWPDELRMPAKKLVEELNKLNLGFELSSPSFSRIKRKDMGVSLSMYVKVVDALEEYLKLKAGVVYDENQEKFVPDNSIITEPNHLLKNTPQSFVASYPNLPTETIKQAIRESQIGIDFLQSYFSFVVEIKEELKMAIREGRRVRILLPRPKSEFLNRRKRELIETEGDRLDEKALQTIKALRELTTVNPSGNALEIRFLDQDIGTSINIIRIDHHIYQGYYWKEKPLTQGPFERKMTNGLVGLSLMKHFEDLWENVGITYKESDFSDFIEELEGHKRSRKSEEYTGTQDDNFRYFRGYYFHRSRTRQFILKVSKAKENAGFLAEIVKSESESNYKGTLEKHVLENGFLLDGLLRETDRGGSCRSAHLSMILDNSDSELFDRKCVFGTICTQEIGKNILICSKIVMIGILDYSIDKPEIIPLSQTQERLGVSKSFVQRYIQENYLEVKETKDLFFTLAELNDPSLDQRLILKDISGIYRLYSIVNETNKLRQGWLKIDSNGILWIPGYESSLLNGASEEENQSLERIYPCKLKIIGKDHIFISTKDSIGGPHFNAVFKHSSGFHSSGQNGVMKGIYSGYKKKESGSLITVPRGGRVLALREAETQYRDDEDNYHEKLDQFFLEMSTNIPEISWHSPKVNDLEERFRGFRNFFCGLDNHFIENPIDLISGKSWLKFHPGDPLMNVAGTYDWYYKSSAELEGGGIRKLMLNLNPDGTAEVLQKNGSQSKGLATRFGSNLLIWLFHKESNWPNAAPRMKEEFNYARFQSIFNLYITDFATQQAPHAKMIGLFMEYSRTGEPLARKVALIPSENQGFNTKMAKPTVIPLGKTSFGFSKNEDQILKYLNDEQFHFVKTRKDFNSNLDLNNPKNQKFKKGFLRAAISFAEGKDYNQALIYLELAMKFGLKIDEPELTIHLKDKNATLFRIGKRIDKLFNNS